MALGMLLIIVSGWIDLSVGSVVAVVGALAGVLMVRYDVNWVLVVAISLLLGAAIGAFQGYWVAYLKIPAFIVTLAGMLIFRGLTIALLQGESVGPFPRGFQNISSGFIPDFFHYEGFHITTILIGVILSVLLIWLDVRARKNQQKYGFEVTPFYFFVIKNIAITAAVMGLCYLMASYKGLPNVLVLLFVLIACVCFYDQPDGNRSPHLCNGRQCKSCHALGCQYDALVILYVCQYGCSRRPGRFDRCSPLK